MRTHTSAVAKDRTNAEIYRLHGRASLDPELIDADTMAIEVRIRWGAESVLEVAHVRPGERFVIGAGVEANFRLDLEQLGLSEDVVLVDEQGALWEPGAAPRGLAKGERHSFALGGLTVDVTRIVEAKATRRGALVALDGMHYVGGVAVLGLLFMGIIAFAVPSGGGLVFDPLSSPSRMAELQVLSEAHAEEFAEPEPEASAPEVGAGDPGQRHEGAEGAAGLESAADQNRRFAVRGSASETVLPNRTTREEMADIGAVLGVAQALRGFHTLSTPFGADTAIGGDQLDAIGRLLGETPGDSFGFGGLGDVGTGSGGGGDGRGTIGLGDRGVIPDGFGCQGGMCEGGAGRLGPLSPGSRMSRVPRITPRRPTVMGDIAPETIRRVVRRHRNEVRFCYEQGLQRRPDLEGRVTTRFMIGPSGAVSAVSIPSSDLRDQSVESCIASKVRTWSFPRGDGGGPVAVTYPFTLHAN